jgi:hypothetical protein
LRVAFVTAAEKSAMTRAAERAAVELSEWLRSLGMREAKRAVAAGK